MSHKLVEIIWDDAHVVGASGSWTDAEEVRRLAARPAEAHTSGYIVLQNEHVIAIAPSFTTDADDPGKVGEYGPTISIPRGMVRKIRTLK